MTIFFYSLAGGALLLSLIKSRKNTWLALKKAWFAFERILPQFLAILLIIGLVLAYLTPQQIGLILGVESGWMGVFTASIIGAITLIPGFVAFPLAASLLAQGAGYMQIGAFISSLMMVGVVTLPMEIQYFGKKPALIRNGAAFLFSLLAALVIGVLVK